MREILQYQQACVTLSIIILNGIIFDLLINLKTKRKWLRIAADVVSIIWTVELTQLCRKTKTLNELLTISILIAGLYLLIKLTNIINCRTKTKAKTLLLLYIGFILYGTIFYRIGKDLAFVAMTGLKEMCIRLRKEFYFWHLIVNILLFVPIGTLLPFLDKNYHKQRYTIPGMVFSACLEAIQLRLFMGECDIADVLGNTLGTSIGIALYPAAVLMAEKYFANSIFAKSTKNDTR